MWEREEGHRGMPPASYHSSFSRTSSFWLPSWKVLSPLKRKKKKVLVLALVMICPLKLKSPTGFLPLL